MGRSSRNPGFSRDQGSLLHGFRRDPKSLLQFGRDQGSLLQGFRRDQGIATPRIIAPTVVETRGFAQ